MKKGFTLVELLAVILILGIISLIAIPSVTKIIREAKINSSKRNAEQYVKSVEDKIAYEILKGNYLFGEYDVTDLNLKIKGTKPTSGTIIIENENIVDCYLEYNNKSFTCSQLGVKNADDNYSVNFTMENGEQFSCRAKGIINPTIVYFDPVEGNKCTKEEYEDNLNSYSNQDIAYLPGENNDYEEETIDATGLKTGCMKWYVISSSNAEVNLLLDHNTTAKSPWNSIDYDGTYGPKDVLEQLYNDTSLWTGVSSRNDIYRYDNLDIQYEIDYTGYRARLVEAQEIARLTGSREWYDETAKYYIDDDESYETFFNMSLGVRDYCVAKLWDYDYNYQDEEKFWSQYGNYKYSWLLDYTDGSHGQIMSSTNGGYWTSSLISDNYNSAWAIDYDIYIYYDDVYSNYYGVRPVITISKSLIN